MVDELAKGCAEVCEVAAGATTRGAQVDGVSVRAGGGEDPKNEGEIAEKQRELARECTWPSQEDTFQTAGSTSGNIRGDTGQEGFRQGISLCLLRIRPEHEAQAQERAGVVIECKVNGIDVEILDIGFFDDNQLLVIIRTRDLNTMSKGRAHIGMIYYRELGWTEDVWGGQEVVSREGLIEVVMHYHETDRVRGGAFSR
ncbi:hypothetical protein AG1IA_04306 [Rhizoctonia solani AG-1 IA]|uniref:Uncharacterized protein n=1 Tax=Thanatephorus cucumeris (strain AG1-IA) TaxID=983506 RepID=L8WY33_THACA|nr:hypothetical protein AG1IA_04306 [Rhizoctonia solani AG-1 IA]